MRVSSKKAKGRRLQDAVVESLYENFDSLRQGDIKPAIMGESGKDVKLSPLAEDTIPFDIECKNMEKINVWNEFKQAESNTKNGRMPLLVFKRNRSDTYAMLKWEDLLKLLKKEQG